MPGAKLDQTIAMAKKVPKGRYSSLKDTPEKSRHGGFKVLKKAGGGKDANRKEAPLPKHIMEQFPDADLTGVKVVYDSPEASKRGVQGFAEGDVIELAPGVDTDKVLRHEAAHIVQQRAGKGAKGAKGSKADAEKKAEKAEGKGKMSSKELGSAPEGPLNKEHNLNDSGLPKLEFDGFKFEKVSGEFNHKLAETEWKEKKLFDKSVWWRIPAFPAAGLYVKATGAFKPEASLTAKAKYEWDATKKAFTVAGALEGELKGSLSFAVEGGAGINLVIQKGGVGLEAAAVLDLSAKLSRSLSFSVSEKGVSFSYAPLEFDLSALLKATLSLALWTEGWFWDDKWKWTFAEFNIASLTGYKALVEIGAGAGKSLDAAFKQVKPGTFKWGSPPEATESNGKKV